MSAASGGPPSAAAVAEARRWLADQGVPVPEPPAPSASRPSGPADRSTPADPETEEQRSAARAVALRKLTARAHSRSELSKALRAKEVPDDVAEAVLDGLEEVGLVDDAAFAAEWVASRQRRRHLSRAAIRRELATKGVDRDDIEQAVSEVDHDDELAAARDLVRRRHASVAALPYEVAYRRLAGALARRGFGAGTTSRVVREVLHGDD